VTEEIKNESITGSNELETALKLTPEQQIIALSEQLSQSEQVIENITFFSNPIRFNSTLFQGFKLILDKVVEIEAKLIKIEEKLNGNKV